jgi:peptide/nickel transport system permease protein
MKRAMVRGLPATVVVLLAIAGPWFAPHDVDDPVVIPYGPPGAGAPLGGDQLGRDVLSQLLAGGWALLLMASVIAVGVTAIAAVLGTVAVLRPGFGTVLERCTDLMMLVPPVLAILLVMLSWPESGVAGLVLLAVAIGTPYASRVVAAAAAGIAASGYIESAVAGGERLGHLVWLEVLPNLRSTLATLLGLRFVEAVYVVSTAAFLQLPTLLGSANWALMIRENTAGILLNPWAVLAPSLAIGVLAVSVNLAAGAFAPRWNRSAA